MMKNMPYFKLFFFLGFFLVGKNAQAMDNYEYDNKPLSYPMLVKFGTFSDYETENALPNLTLNPTYFADDKENIKEAYRILSNVLLYTKNTKNESVLKKISIECLEEAKKYTITCAYQTEELRQFSNKNFFFWCLFLKSSSILYDEPEAHRLWEETKKSNKYGIECCDAFLAADEEAGITYSSQEESEIHHFFSNQLDYIENIEKFDLFNIVKNIT